MSDQFYAEQIEKVWQTLPETTAEMASFFARQGVTGQRSAPQRCVIANYVRDMLSLPAEKIVFVALGGMSVEDEDEWGEPVNGEYFPLPKHVQDFIQEFDHKMWPGLEQT